MHRAAWTLVALGVLTACSGADDPPGSAPAPATATPSAAKQAYVRAAEAVCAQAVTAARAIAQPDRAAQLVPAYEQLIAVGERGVTGLGRLTPPPEDAAALRTGFLDPVAAQLAGLRATLPRVRAAAASADPVRAFALIPDPVKAVTVDLELLARYGMPQCAAFAGSE